MSDPHSMTVCVVCVKKEMKKPRFKEIMSNFPWVTWVERGGTSKICFDSLTVVLNRWKFCLFPLPHCCFFVLQISSFVFFPFRLVIYGQYCSGVESAISNLDYISKTKEDVKLKLEVPIYFCLFMK